MLMITVGDGEERLRRTVTETRRARGVDRVCNGLVEMPIQRRSSDVGNDAQPHYPCNHFSRLLLPSGHLSLFLSLCKLKVSSSVLFKSDKILQ